MTTTIDEAKTEEFVGKVLGDLSGLMTAAMASVGDRLGLFADLADNGPATPDDLARRAGVDARYAREWLGGMTTAGYLTHDPASGSFALPAEHVPALADEGGAVFFGGALQEALAALEILGQIVDAFRNGGGVAQEDYPPDFYHGLERFTAGWFENLLLPVWIPAVPEVERALERGCDLADVGCGAGRALVKLAEAFPKSRFVGYDVHGPSLKRARKAAKEAGVDDRVRFNRLDVSDGIPKAFDVITTFDVVHDAVDPKGLLGSIKEALKPDGTYLCLDINCSDRLEDMAGPLGTVFHGFSLLYCMTSSLAHGGAGLGTVGLHERRLSELASEAGFGSCRRLPLENPFNNLYELKP